MVAGPISLLGYLRVEVFGAEDHGVVDTQVGPCVAAVVCGCTCYLGLIGVFFCRCLSRRTLLAAAWVFGVDG